MFETLERVETELAAMAASFDPGAVPADQVVGLYEQLERVQRRASSMQTMLASRVEASMHWQRSGYRTPAEYLAATSGSTVTAAQNTLATSSKLASLPVIEDALRAGKLSAAQAVLVADAASSAPSHQSRLVLEAQHTSLRELRGECLRTKAASDPDPDATHTRIHATRYWRTHIDAEGAWNLSARATIDTGSRIEAALRPFIDDEFEKARREGRRESFDAYALDAFTRLATHPGTAADMSRPERPPLRTLALLRVDLAALTRGATAEQDTCEIAGLGPVPVNVARKLLGESILKLVITNGTAVRTVVHLGRGPTTAQRVALLWEQPLCTVEGCYRTRCDIDHTRPWAQTRHTRLDELDHLCDHHHDKKTREGWAVVGGTGKRPMVPPGDRRHPNHGPPP